MGGRRAARQDARRRRPRPGRAPWWPSAPSPSACASSPTTRSCPSRPGPPHGRRADEPRGADGRGRLRLRPPAQEHGDARPDRDRDLLARSKPGLRIINTARGGIVDEEALAEAIRDGKVQGAGLDVFAKEPTTESPLFELPSVVVVPAPRRLDRRGPGQGRRHHRRAGPAGPGRRLRALRGQRRGHRRVRDGPPLHGAGRAAGPVLRRPATTGSRHPRDRVPGRAGRRRAPGS